ncbi:hypothetical protein AB6896_13950 [Rahnella inusitata]|uniref:hypothetical protein n=1 Tax=Rahnella inusitata TaxID=58169 RepID=UPI0039BE1CEA
MNAKVKRYMCLAENLTCDEERSAFLACLNLALDPSVNKPFSLDALNPPDRIVMNAIVSREVIFSDFVVSHAPNGELLIHSATPKGLLSYQHLI